MAICKSNQFCPPGEEQCKGSDRVRPRLVWKKDLGSPAACPTASLVSLHLSLTWDPACQGRLVGQCLRMKGSVFYRRPGGKAILVLKNIYFKKYFRDWGSWRAVPYKVFSLHAPHHSRRPGSLCGNQRCELQTGGWAVLRAQVASEMLPDSFCRSWWGEVRAWRGRGGWGGRIAHHPLLPPGTRPSWPGLALGSWVFPGWPAHHGVSQHRCLPDVGVDCPAKASRLAALGNCPLQG